MDLHGSHRQDLELFRCSRPSFLMHIAILQGRIKKISKEGVSLWEMGVAISSVPHTEIQFKFTQASLQYR